MEVEKYVVRVIEFFGIVGDFLVVYNGMMFSMLDLDNDVYDFYVCV